MIEVGFPVRRTFQLEVPIEEFLQNERHPVNAVLQKYSILHENQAPSGVSLLCKLVECAMPE